MQMFGTKESFCIRKEFNSHRIYLGHQHGRRFIVWTPIWPPRRHVITLYMKGWEFYLLTYTKGQGNLSFRPVKQTASSLLFFLAKSLHEKPKHASGEGSKHDKRGRKPEEKKTRVRLFSFGPNIIISYCNVTSWFTVALVEIRTRRNLREKVDCKQSTCKKASKRLL